MKATVTVTFKNGVLEPQGKATQHSLHSLGFAGVNEVRIGKFIEIDLDARDARQARERITAMCEELLASPVIENYQIQIAGSRPAAKLAKKAAAKKTATKKSPAKKAAAKKAATKKPTSRKTSGSKSAPAKKTTTKKTAAKKVAAKKKTTSRKG